MTCAACQARVQRTLQRQQGVADATVNLMMHTATVAYDPLVVAPERLVVFTADDDAYRTAIDLAAVDQGHLAGRGLEHQG